MAIALAIQPNAAPIRADELGLGAIVRKRDAHLAAVAQLSGFHVGACAFNADIRGGMADVGTAAIVVVTWIGAW